jgi:hypothetical protein
MSNWWNPLFSFAVRAQHRLQVLFRILPVGGTATPIVVSTNAAVDRRVDFAGALFEGNIMSETDYTEVQKDGEL